MTCLCMLGLGCKCTQTLLMYGPLIDLYCFQTPTETTGEYLYSIGILDTGNTVYMYITQDTFNYTSLISYY